MSSEDMIDCELVYHWRDLKHKPKFIIFDLDHTLWPFAVDTNIVPPFRRIKEDKNSIITDLNDLELKGFEDVPKILNTLFEYCFMEGEKMAVASRSRRKDLALKLIELLDWKKYFHSIQIYSMPKNNHIFAIKSELNIKDFKDVLFFDDNKSNIEVANQLGICSFFVDKNIGLNLFNVHCAFDIFEKQYYLDKK